MFLNVLTAMSVVLPSSAFASTGPDMHAVSTISCNIQDMNNNLIKRIELRPETLDKTSGDVAKAGDDKTFRLPGRPELLSFAVTIEKSRRDEQAVMRYGEVLAITLFRKGAGSIRELFNQTVYVGEHSNAVVDLRLPAEEIFINCEKNLEIIDTSQPRI